MTKAPTVTKVMVTETAHRLTDYSGKCAHIHGHSYRWEVTALALEGYGLKNGIAIDFGDLKKVMKEEIYNPFDHALVLDMDDPLLISTEIDLAADGTPQKILVFPGNPTAENFSMYVAQNMQEALDNRFPLQYLISKVRVWETANSYAEWRAVRWPSDDAAKMPGTDV